MLAIGASTGGPAAIVEVLRGLPANARRPILLVLHINEPFGLAFAEWLDGQTHWRVGYPRDGDTVACLRGAGDHGTARPPSGGSPRQSCCLTQDPERHSCRPSVDVLFESVAREYGAAAAGVLLTGMGKDGAAGLLDIRRAGGLTIAQDEASSVVYGMPREAALIGAAEQILPLKKIGPALAALVANKMEERA